LVPITSSIVGTYALLEAFKYFSTNPLRYPWYSNHAVILQIGVLAISCTRKAKDVAELKIYQWDSPGTGDAFYYMIAARLKFGMYVGEDESI